MAVRFADIVNELREAGYIPAEVEVFVGSPWGPSAVLPLECTREEREFMELQVGIHLPDELDPEGWGGEDAQLELQLLRDKLTQAGLPDDDLALARFFVLHEVGHWVHFMQEGELPFAEDLILRLGLLVDAEEQEWSDEEAAKRYRQLPVEVRADAYALEQLKQLYGRS